MSEPPATRLTPADAVRAILDEIAPLPIEHVALADGLDRVLAEDVTSPMDIPPWDNSAMDGYATRREEVAAGGRGRQRAVELRIVETVPAGAFPTKSLGPGECARVFTGAPVPEGADTVIRQEDTTRLDGDRVQINADRDVGKNVRKRGEDIEQGSVVLSAGSPLGSAQLGVLASVAMSRVPVHRQPSVALLTSGDELADLDERDAIVRGRKISSSNTYTLMAMVRQAAARPINLGIAADDPRELKARLKQADAADVLVTSGAMSVGEHDYLRSLLDEEGTDTKFWRIRMRPGAPVGFGLRNGKPWVGLPGNPVSTMVTFELLVRPAIRKLQGHTKLFRRAVPVCVGEPIETAPGLQHFLRVRLTTETDTPTARLTGPQGSGTLSSMARADALLIVPEGTTSVAQGETLDAIVLADGVHVETPPYEQ